MKRAYRQASWDRALVCPSLQLRRFNAAIDDAPGEADRLSPANQARICAPGIRHNF